MPSYPVGQAPWETNVANSGTANSFPVGQAPWETGIQGNQTSSPDPAYQQDPNAYLQGVVQKYASGPRNIFQLGEQSDNSLGSNLIDSTIGVKGVLGTVANIGAPINAQLALGNVQDIGNSRNSLNQSADFFMKKAQTEQDPARKQKLLDTAKHILGESQTLGETQGQITDETARRTGQDVSIGKNIENIFGTAVNAAATLGPGMLGKAKTLGAKVGQGALIGGSAGVGQGMVEGKNLTDTLKGGAIGAGIGGFLPILMKGLGSFTKNIVGKTSGVGTDVIQQSIDNPQAVGNAVKEYAQSPEAKQELVDRAKAGISTFLQERNTQYGESLNSLTSKGQFMGKQAVADSFEKNVGTFGGTIKNGELTFTDSALTKSDQSALGQAFDTIKNWKDTSVKGIDTLRQAIGNMMDEFKMTGNSRANVILGKVKQDLVSATEKGAPGYEKMLGDYGSKSQLARNVMKELSLGGAAKPSTQLNQILKLFNKDPQLLKEVRDILGKNSDKFINDLTGAILSEWLPAGKVGNATRALLEGGGAVGAKLFGVANPTIGAGLVTGLAASSPRIVGAGARLAGRAAQSGVSGAIRKGATLVGGKIAGD